MDSRNMRVCVEAVCDGSHMRQSLTPTHVGLVRPQLPSSVVTARYEIAAENKRLSEPLARALKEVEVLRSALASADKDKASLAQSKARLAAAEKQVRAGCGSSGSGRRVLHGVVISRLLQCQAQYVCQQKAHFLDK